ncbi:hypothetical protein [Geoalkalibacter halelectricus]|uniref:hypothetical protein n=1 Tax=Geoalkalibacter halelectricus TaxID=2847045 RepID=UPI003D1FD3EC
MSSERGGRKFKFFDAHKITETLVKEGAQLIYCREALYPVIEAEVRVREKSRDQLGDIEKTILALLEACPASPESISSLMGVREGSLYPILVELEGRGLVERGQGGAYGLSELGKLSAQYGVEVVDVDRALLLCGITGRLLPRNLYSVQRFSPSELKQRARSLDLVPEESQIELSALDMNKIQDRRAVNLADETMAIVGIIQYKPAFLLGILVFYKNYMNYEAGEIVFPGETIDWLPMEKIWEFFSEPLGFSAKMTAPEVLKKIEEILISNGVELAREVSLDKYGNPLVELKSLSHKALNFQYRGRPFLLYIGTDRYKSVPLGQFPFGKERGFNIRKCGDFENDLLYGRAITFIATGSDLKEQADSLRCIEHAIQEYYSIMPTERSNSSIDFIIEKVEKIGLNSEVAFNIGKKYGTKNLKKILNTDSD